MTEPTKDQKIWQVVAAIPPGCVASYGQIADMAKLPEGHTIPWYRVIRSNGQIAFPIGNEAFEKQAQSLREEGVLVVDGRISMKQFQWRP